MFFVPFRNSFAIETIDQLMLVNLLALKDSRRGDERCERLFDACLRLAQQRRIERSALAGRQVIAATFHQCFIVNELFSNAIRPSPKSALALKSLLYVLIVKEELFDSNSRNEILNAYKDDWALGLASIRPGYVILANSIGSLLIDFSLLKC